MPSGGWRPGAGRPRKIITEIKVKRPVGRPKKIRPEEPVKEQTKVVAEPVKVSDSTVEFFEQVIQQIVDKKKLTAVEFLSMEMNNESNPFPWRLQCAQLLAPYETPKLAPIAKGKKEDKAAKAGEVIKGARFGQSPPPRLVNQ